MEQSEHNGGLNEVGGLIKWDLVDHDLNSTITAICTPTDSKNKDAQDIVCAGAVSVGTPPAHERCHCYSAGQTALLCSFLKAAFCKDFILMRGVWLCGNFPWFSA